MTGVFETIPAYPLKLSWSSRGLIDVTADSPTIASPLRTLGLSDQVLEWLLDAGIATAPLDRPSVRQGRSQSQRAILLFDSRDASARLDAETADALGYATIDAAQLLAKPRPHDHPDQTILMAGNPRRRFLDGLRLAMEEAGGVWLRIADFPHPYRALICEDVADSNQKPVPADPRIDRVLNAFAEIPSEDAGAGRLAIADWLTACQIAGRPMRTTTPIAHWPGRGRRMRVEPLTWTASLDSFAQWWHFRSGLTFTAVRRGRRTELSITAPCEPGQTVSWQPALEVWRGRHCAILPVNSGTIMIHDDSIPFQLQTNRHHAGFLADESEIGPSRYVFPPITIAS